MPDTIMDGLALADDHGLAAPTVEGVTPTVEGPPNAISSALTLARTLLPTAPLPVVEYNLPVLEVQM